MTSQECPTRVLGGVTVPSTPIISKALEFAEYHMEPIGYRHVVRSWLYAILVASRLPPAPRASVDLEALSVASILHDLGWSAELSSKDKIFEVDGANAARDFILREGEKAQWEKRRVQLVWDSIALHTHPSVATHKEAEVAFTATGIMVELFGSEFMKAQAGDLVQISQEDSAKINEEFPRNGLKDHVKDIMCGFCREKPQVTYTNWVAGFGDKYVDGYSSKGKQIVDLMEGQITE